MSVPDRPIVIRWPNEDTGGYFKVNGFLVNPQVGLAVFDGNLEVHIIEPTSDQGEYELKYASNPMFKVGVDLERIQRDLSELTVLEFAERYAHSDFDFSGPPMRDPELEAIELKIRCLVDQFDREGVTDEMMRVWEQVWHEYTSLCTSRMEGRGQRGLNPPSEVEVLCWIETLRKNNQAVLIDRS